VGPLDPVPENEALKEPSGAQRGSDGSTAFEPSVRAGTPEKLHLQISLEDVPEPISSLFQKLANPHRESKLRGFVKDYSSLLTPILTAIITGLVAFYGYKFDDHVSKDTLDKITTEFVGGADASMTAMRLAAYGDKALPAVKIALGAKKASIRDGAVEIAAQMYFAETVDREDLAKAMLTYYDNPVLRIGVLEWLATIESSLVPLSDNDSKAAFGKLKQTFGSVGGRCAEQGPDMAQAAANFLSAGSIGDRRDFVLGMDEHCPKDKEFDGTHKILHEALGPK